MLSDRSAINDAQAKTEDIAQTAEYLAERIKREAERLGISPPALADKVWDAVPEQDEAA